MKIKLYGIGNEENFNHYEFDKKQEVAEKLAEILYKVFKVLWKLTEERENKKGDLVVRKINVSTYKDFHQTINHRNPRVDVFYGSKKMFITLNCPQKDRLRFNEELFKIALMPKPKKVKSLRGKGK